MPISLLSLNIEEDKHLDRILPFLSEQRFDIVCLQEVLQKDLSQLAAAAQAQAFFVPLADLNPGKWGIALLVRQGVEVSATHQQYYKGDKFAPLAARNSLQLQPNSISRAVLSAMVKKDNQSFTVTTTHFTWADKGGTNLEQKQDFPQLLRSLDEIGETILCGDFNAPRGLEIFTALAKKYTDNIPAQITTTLDQDLHRKKGLQLVVDGLFSSPSYQVTNVQVTSGISDHCGISAIITPTTA